MDDVLKLNCVHEMYQTSILLQQINYAVLEEKYNELSGKTLYIKEDTDQKKQSIFSKIITTLKTWIGKLITFITKTIPNWIKRQIEKISNIFKRRGNAKVVNTEKLPEKHKVEVKKLANSANKVTKNARKIEEIKSSEDGSSYLVDSLKKMNTEMKRQTNAAMDDLDNTKYDAAMNITNRHAELAKSIKELEERQKKYEKEYEENMKEVEALARLDRDSEKDKEIQKKQDQTDKDLDDISKELDSILDDIKDAVDKKEDVVVIEKPAKKEIVYKYFDLKYFERDCSSIIGHFNKISNEVSQIVYDIDSLDAMGIIDNKATISVSGRIHTIRDDLSAITNSIAELKEEKTRSFIVSRHMPKIEYQKIQIPKGLSNDAVKSLKTALNKLNSFSSDDSDINKYKDAGIKQITAILECYNKIVSEYSKFLMYRIEVYTKVQQDVRIEIRDDF